MRRQSGNVRVVEDAVAVLVEPSLLQHVHDRLKICVEFRLKSLTLIEARDEKKINRRIRKSRQVSYLYKLSPLKARLSAFNLPNLGGLADLIRPNQTQNCNFKG